MLRSSNGLVVAVAVAGLIALAMAGTTGTAYAQEAEYDWDSNILTLNFTDKLNPFLNDITAIHIYDESCVTYLTSAEFLGLGPDWLVATFNLTEVNRQALASMGRPMLWIPEDTFSWLDGEPLGALDIPLAATGAAHDQPLCPITYGFSESIMRAYSYNYTETVLAIQEGFSAWSEINPNLTFARTDAEPTIEIYPTDYSEEHVGLACIDCLLDLAYMDIILYSYDCNGARVYYTPDSIRNTVAHELGHILGLEHHEDGNHLMHGDEYMQHPFLTLGYAIPELLPEWLIGEEELDAELTMLDGVLNQTEAELAEMWMDLDRFANNHTVERGSDGTIYFDTQSRVNQYNRMIGEYNDLVDDYNLMIGEYNDLTEEYNCLLNVAPEPEGGAPPEPEPEPEPTDTECYRDENGLLVCTPTFEPPTIDTSIFCDIEPVPDWLVC